MAIIESLDLNKIPQIEQGRTSGEPIVLLPGIITHRREIRASGLSPRDYATLRGLFLEFNATNGSVSFLDTTIPVKRIHEAIQAQGIDPIREASAVWFAGRGYNGISKLAGKDEDKYYLKTSENGPKFEVGFVSNPTNSGLVIPEVLHTHDKCNEMFFVTSGSIHFAVNYDGIKGELAGRIEVKKGQNWTARAGNEHLLLGLEPKTDVIIVKVPVGTSVVNPDKDWTGRREHFSKIRNC